jgi:hypothetical protein
MGVCGYPWDRDPVPIVDESGGGRQGRTGRVLKISLPPGIDPRTVQSVASRYTDLDIPAHLKRVERKENLLKAHQIRTRQMFFDWPFNCGRRTCDSTLSYGPYANTIILCYFSFLLMERKRNES